MNKSKCADEQLTLLFDMNNSNENIIKNVKTNIINFTERQTEKNKDFFNCTIEKLIRHLHD